MNLRILSRRSAIAAVGGGVRDAAARRRRLRAADEVPRDRGRRHQRAKVRRRRVRGPDCAGIAGAAAQVLRVPISRPADRSAPILRARVDLVTYGSNGSAQTPFKPLWGEGLYRGRRPRHRAGRTRHRDLSAPRLRDRQSGSDRYHGAIRPHADVEPGGRASRSGCPGKWAFDRRPARARQGNRYELAFLVSPPRCLRLLAAAALWAFGAASAQAQSRFRAIEVDVAPLRAGGNTDAADRVARELPPLLKKSFAARLAPGDKSAPILRARIDFVTLGTAGSAGGPHSIIAADFIEGAGVVVGPGGRVVATYPLTAISRPPSRSTISAGKAIACGFPTWRAASRNGSPEKWAFDATCRTRCWEIACASSHWVRASPVMRSTCSASRRRSARRTNSGASNRARSMPAPRRMGRSIPRIGPAPPARSSPRPFPDIVIACGRVTVPYIRALKRERGRKRLRGVPAGPAPSGAPRWT